MKSQAGIAAEVALTTSWCTPFQLPSGKIYIGASANAVLRTGASAAALASAPAAERATPSVPQLGVGLFFYIEVDPAVPVWCTARTITGTGNLLHFVGGV